MRLWFTDLPMQLRTLKWKERLSQRVNMPDSPMGLTPQEFMDRWRACEAALAFLTQANRFGLGTKVGWRIKVYNFVYAAMESRNNCAFSLELEATTIASFGPDNCLMGLG